MRKCNICGNELDQLQDDYDLNGQVIVIAEFCPVWAYEYPQYKKHPTKKETINSGWEWLK